MSQLTKQQLQVENQVSFPNNNTGYITPQALRGFNSDLIDSVVVNGATSSFATTGSNTYTGDQLFYGSYTINMHDAGYDSGITANTLYVESGSAYWYAEVGVSGVGDNDKEVGISINGLGDVTDPLIYSNTGLGEVPQISFQTDSVSILNNVIVSGDISGSIVGIGNVTDYSASVDYRLNNAQGTTGTQGAQGASGTNGTQGATGTGLQGAQGVQGPGSAQGQIGIQGAQGYIGSQGTQGRTGAGTQGATGSTGGQGATGATGNQGEQGIQGAQGTQGTIGEKGDQGIQGANGSNGAQGSQGTTGAGTQGATGTQGSVGTQGSTGAGTQGAQGANGANGSQGANGTQGAIGTQGSTGSGTQGTQGTIGSQGAIGAQGTQGTTPSTANFATTGSNYFTGKQEIDVALGSNAIQIDSGDLSVAGISYTQGGILSYSDIRLQGDSKGVFISKNAANSGSAYSQVFVYVDNDSDPTNVFSSVNLLDQTSGNGLGLAWNSYSYYPTSTPMLFANQTYNGYDAVFGFPTNVVDVLKPSNFKAPANFSGSVNIHSGSYNGTLVNNITPVSSSQAAVANIVTLTASEYAGILTPEPTTLYIVI